MNNPDRNTFQPASRRPFLLLGLPVLAAALFWAGLTAIHKAHEMRQALHEFRGDTIPDPGPNRRMADALLIRSALIRYPTRKLSAGQGAALVGLVNGSADDQSQSEALDVLGLARRANALSAGQEQEAESAALGVLGRSPGPMVRLESARMLGHFGDPRGIPALLVLQQDGEPKIQAAAALALAKCRGHSK